MRNEIYRLISRFARLADRSNAYGYYCESHLSNGPTGVAGVLSGHDRVSADEQPKYAGDRRRRRGDDGTVPNGRLTT